jgi:hypothetical protein
MPITAGMALWLAYCNDVAPECASIWKRLYKLDYQADADKLTKWLKRLLSREPPPQNINGLWFGLYNPVLWDRMPTCQMYVGGSSAFDPKSESNEWVCELAYSPRGRYSKSSVLTGLYRTVEPITTNNVNYLGEPFLCYGFLALLVSSWCHGPMRTTLLGDAPARAVVIGHDSGDFYRMAVLLANASPRSC